LPEDKFEALVQRHDEPASSKTALAASPALARPWHGAITAGIMAVDTAGDRLLALVSPAPSSASFKRRGPDSNSRTRAPMSASKLPLNVKIEQQKRRTRGWHGRHLGDCIRRHQPSHRAERPWERSRAAEANPAALFMSPQLDEVCFPCSRTCKELIMVQLNSVQLRFNSKSSGALGFELAVK
jgi:hypothetical protein